MLLFLIDEFGTGSDPELGGALAEAILEVFYEKKSLGLITTHYTNLKLLANELDSMENANMQFNEDTLEPVFNLITGEAGSSFTFEVAEKNGIPYSLINRAKKKIERGKVRFDATIAKLQKQRMQLDKTTSSLKDEESKFKRENEKLNVTNDKIKSKLINYQELFELMESLIKGPDLLIYLRSSIPNLFNKIHKRGREFENSISIDYLSRLNERYEAWTSTYDKGKIIIIDVDEIDFVESREDLNSIISKIDEAITS